MKGGIAAMLSATLVICTNTDEESSGLGSLACARHGVRELVEVARGIPVAALRFCGPAGQ